MFATFDSLFLVLFVFIICPAWRKSRRVQWPKGPKCISSQCLYLYLNLFFVFVKTVGYQVVSQKVSVCAVKEAFEEKPARKSFSLFVAFTEFTTRGNANKGVL